jgi:hypothetical protein
VKINQHGIEELLQLDGSVLDVSLTDGDSSVFSVLVRTASPTPARG